MKYILYIYDVPFTMIGKKNLSPTFESKSACSYKGQLSHKSNEKTLFSENTM